MKMTDSKYFLDSSVWLAYFKGEIKESKRFVEGNNLLLSSSISLFEIKRRLLQEGFSKENVQKHLNFMKNKSIIVETDQELFEEAAETSIALKLPAIDSVIYTSANKQKATLVTSDSHFENVKDVQFLQ